MEEDLWSLDFSEWPYRFSNTDNRFMVIGCNTLAYIYNIKQRDRIHDCVCIGLCEPKGIDKWFVLRCRLLPK